MVMMNFGECGDGQIIKLCNTHTRVEMHGTFVLAVWSMKKEAYLKSVMN